MAMESCAGEREKKKSQSRRESECAWESCGTASRVQDQPLTEEGEERGGEEGRKEGGREEGRGSQGGMSAPIGCMWSNTQNASQCKTVIDRQTDIVKVQLAF